jgi:hypothetical protein
MSKSNTCDHTFVHAYSRTHLTSIVHNTVMNKNDLITILFKIGGNISTDVNKEIKEEKKKKKKKTETAKQSVSENREKEELEKIVNNDFLNDTNLAKKRKSENIENIDSYERKKKKESNEIGENLQFNASKNTDFEKNGRELKRVSTGASVGERTTLASLPSDRQTPVLECLKGRLVTIERSCKYHTAARILHSKHDDIYTN